MRTPLLIALALLFATASLAHAQGRAYRSVDFGDSLEVVTNKVLDDLHFMNGLGNPARADTSFPEQLLHRNRYVLVDIAGTRYRVYFDFFDDKLFRVSFFTHRPHTANYFDTLVSAERDALVNVITSARGAPTSTTRLSFLDMQTGFVRWSHVWSPNADGTEHFIGIGEWQHTYFAAMRIQWAWLAGLYEAALQRAADEDEQDAVGDF